MSDDQDLPTDGFLMGLRVGPCQWRSVIALERGSLKLLDVVALDRDLPEHGLRRGASGTIVEVHPDAFDVEFLRESTTTVVTVKASDVRWVRP